MAPQHKDGQDEPEYPQVSFNRQSRPHPRLAVGPPKLPPPPPGPAPPALPAPPAPPTPPTAPMVPPPPPVASGNTEATSDQSSSYESKWGYPSNLSPRPSPSGGPSREYPSPRETSESLTSWVTSATTPTTPTPFRSGPEASRLTTSSAAFVTDGETRSTEPPFGHGGPPDWPKDKENNGGMYAGAAITPIVVLAIIGGLILFCMRKRKRQHEKEAIRKRRVEEMRMHTQSQVTARPYMAEPAVASPPYSYPPSQLLAPPNPSVPQPVILGPIPTGANGAYFTGMDTSDVVSITSTNNLRPGPLNRFSDNDSLAEPPPPYRPRSAAPPSFANTSRQSSFRVSGPPSATSQTRLIGRSPFEDPIDDDAVSDISGPTSLGHDGENMSAVSDLSYQHDPFEPRTPL
ncbi:hypothetical protein GQ44DRAFT_702830 [Phaeosphaeriaceae sp. PMI808]|nr:hypothetical protein GQ44DRAFT_702830 [Phaeosphaeriaceae sp. PMI808]